MILESIDTLSDVKFWGGLVCLLAALAAILFCVWPRATDDDDTPVRPPRGSDDWRGWRK